MYVAFYVYTHSVIIIIQKSVEIATPPKKRPSNDDNEFTFFFSPKRNTVRFIPLTLRADNWPSTVKRDFIKLVKSVAVREPSSVENTRAELNRREEGEEQVSDELINMTVCVVITAANSVRALSKSET